MKYNQPYGISDLNAPYINGNPSTGTMGSIPPAASIEYPQREIVNLVTFNGFTPSNSDLSQLAKGVQRGLINYGVDAGEPNKIVITPALPITAYQVGQRFVIKVGFGNTSQVTINVSGLGQVPLIKTDLNQLMAYELRVGQLIEVAYDGANFQAIGGVMTGSVMMTAPTHLYVNNTIGSDTLYDGTQPTISGVRGGPFATIPKALATMQRYNLGGWDFHIHVADGTYLQSLRDVLPLPNGSGSVYLTGNTSNPAAVTIYNNVQGSCWTSFQGGYYVIRGFKFRSTAPWAGTGDAGSCIQLSGNGTMDVGNCHFGNAAFCHVEVGGSAAFYFTGSGDPIVISGNAVRHISASVNGLIYFSGPNFLQLNITTPVNIGTFAYATQGAQLNAHYGTITGKANVTGIRYEASLNGVIYAGGGGATALPGTIAGSVSSGGQYT